MWQKIETAPRDETLVLLYFPEAPWSIEGNIGIGFYSTNADDVPEEDRWFRLESDGNPFDERPTHWMPLPEPPTRETASGG